MPKFSVEILSIGDEMVTGQRLDTNSQWLSQRLGELGVPVRFHTTVGDCLEDHVSALRVSFDRVPLVISTGGLGPTADDLTRQALAAATQVPLELNSAELEHLENFFRRAGRDMTVNNRLQAFFPRGSVPVFNPEGTAPGIDMIVNRASFGQDSEVLDANDLASLDFKAERLCRVFCLPGVPVEMKQMWQTAVAPAIRDWIHETAVIKHHTFHCFGAGESAIEMMLPAIIQRERDPLVGITASAATISLRVSTRAESEKACQEKMQPTIDLIRKCLGNLVFGENGQTLPEVVIDLLNKHQVTLAIMDGGFNGQFAESLSRMQSGHGSPIVRHVVATVSDVAQAAVELQAESRADWALAIGAIDECETAIATGVSYFEVALQTPTGLVTERFRFGGHSEWRKKRAVKQVFNLLRLQLMESPQQQ